jgi:hypothetical protein
MNGMYNLASNGHKPGSFTPRGSNQQADVNRVPEHQNSDQVFYILSAGRWTKEARIWYIDNGTMEAKEL